jgi:two-component system, chemotaxis family, chemotaxis protein CheY
MPARVLDVGQCGPDHRAIQTYLTRNFDCDIAQTDDAVGALALMKSCRFDLVLVNRKLDIDYSDGVDVIRALKAEPATSAVPVMLITNYPEHQEAAIAVGAIRGFGKLEFGKPETRAVLAAVLERKENE